MSVAIRVENLSKYYRLGTINHGMLYKDIQSWMALKLGKQDPHAQIGADHFADRPEGFWALKDLNFDIQQGDRVGIIGKNGAGKSTLLKILSRITAPTEGVIKIKGRVTSLLEVGTGFHGELTGRENIYLNGAILGMKRSEISKKLDEIIAFSEIEQHIDTPVKRYSSGMYVRLAFAVAAHLESEILIADEVLAVGDATFQKKALGKMQDLSTGQGRTVLFVSHNMGAVKRLCTNGVVLERGRIKFIETTSANLVSKYLALDNNENGVFTEWYNKDIPKQEELYLKSMKILEVSCEEIKRPILAEKEYILELDFYYDNPNCSITFDVAFITDDEIPVFIISPFISISGYFPKPGRNILRCKIPSNLLNDKRYRVEFRASLHNIKWIYEPGKNSPYVILTIDQRKNYSPFNEGSTGLLAPFMEWSVI